MNTLDFYLFKHQLKREDIHEKTGISKQMLSFHKNKPIKKYSNQVVNALAEVIGKFPEDVISELLIIENENPPFEVYNQYELLAALEAKFEYILIKGEYCKEVRRIMDTHLSESENLGVELGSAGVLTLLIYAIDAVRDMFSHADKMDIEIDRKLNVYKIKKISDDGILLSLKQLDY